MTEQEFPNMQEQPPAGGRKEQHSPVARMREFWGIVIVALVGLGLAGLLTSWTDKKGAVMRPDQNTFEETPAAVSREGVVSWPSLSSGARVNYKGADWYADGSALIKIEGDKVRYYNRYDGLPSGGADSAVVYHDKLYVTSGGKIARYNPETDRFDVFKAGPYENLGIFLDPYGDKMHASTFDSFMIFDEKQEKWIASRDPYAPFNIRSRFMAFGENVIVTPTQNAHRPPLLAYDRKSERWQPLSLPGLGSQFSNSVINVGGQVIVFGENTNPGQPCGDIFYQFREGEWRKLEEINNKYADMTFSRHNFYDSPEEVVLDGQSCDKEEGKKYLSISLVREGESIVLKREVEYDPRDGQDSSEATGRPRTHEIAQQNLDRLKELTDRPAVYKALALDEDGNILVLSSPSVESWGEGETVAVIDRPEADGEIKEKVLFNMGDGAEYKVIPVYCQDGMENKLSYLIDYGFMAYDGSIKWINIYDIRDGYDNLKPIKVSGGPLALGWEKEICKDGRLYFASHPGISSFDPASGSSRREMYFSDEGTNDFKEIVPDDKGNLWLYFAGQNKLETWRPTTGKREVAPLPPEVPAYSRQEQKQENHLRMAARGRLWFEVPEEKKAVILGENGKHQATLDLSKISNYPYPTLTKIAPLTENWTIIVVEEELYLLNTDNWQVRPVPEEIFPFAFNTSYSSFTPPLIDYDPVYDRVWFSSSSGVFAVPMERLLK